MSCHMEKGTANVNCLLNWGRQNVAYWCVTVLGTQVLLCWEHKYCCAARILSVCEANISEGNKKEGVYKH